MSYINNDSTNNVIANTNSTTWNQNFDHLFTSFDFDEVSIDLEAIKEHEPVVSDMLRELLYKFILCTDDGIKQLLYNTMNSYSIFKEKKAVERKAKINKTTNG